MASPHAAARHLSLAQLEQVSAAVSRQSLAVSALQTAGEGPQGPPSLREPEPEATPQRRSPRRAAAAAAAAVLSRDDSGRGEAAGRAPSRSARGAAIAAAAAADEGETEAASALCSARRKTGLLLLLLVAASVATIGAVAIVASVRPPLGGALAPSTGPAATFWDAAAVEQRVRSEVEIEIDAALAVTRIPPALLSVPSTFLAANYASTNATRDAAPTLIVESTWSAPPQRPAQPRPMAAPTPELAGPLLRAESSQSSDANGAGPRFSLLVDASRMRLHPLHSRLCASVAPAVAHDEAWTLSHAASACMSPSSTQLFWASSRSYGGRAVLAFGLEQLTPRPGDPGRSYIATVSVMDVRGKMERTEISVAASVPTSLGVGGTDEGFGAQGPAIKALW